MELWVAGFERAIKKGKKQKERDILDNQPNPAIKHEGVTKRKNRNWINRD